MDAPVMPGLGCSVSLQVAPPGTKGAPRRTGRTGWLSMRATPFGLTGSSDRTDLLGLRTLGTPGRGVLDPLVVLEAAVTVSLDGGVVNEDVGSAVVGGDE